MGPVTKTRKFKEEELMVVGRLSVKEIIAVIITTLGAASYIWRIESKVENSADQLVSKFAGHEAKDAEIFKRYDERMDALARILANIDKKLDSVTMALIGAAPKK